ncbi:MAG: hypothetical protein GY925_02340 [Actinomycetia bacterium]|nr:hypothetical protein [Actinomycetes bacterium]
MPYPDITATSVAREVGTDSANDSWGATCTARIPTEDVNAAEYIEELGLVAIRR